MNSFSPSSSHSVSPRLRAALGFSAATIFALVGACGEPANRSRDAGVASGDAVCRTGPPRPSVEVEPELATLGGQNRPPRRSGDAIFVVQSGANTVGRYDLESGSYEKDFIDVGEEDSNKGPYDLALDATADRGWITNLQADTVTVADTSTGGVLEEIESAPFDSPSGIELTPERAYVTNVELDGGEFGPGSVTILDRAEKSVLETVETEWKNPQHVRRIETPDGPRIAVVDTGVITRNGEAETAAGLELWRPSDGFDAASRSTYELGVDRENDVGAPSRPLPAPGGRYLYFTSATAPVLFKFDLERREWVRGVSNPIELYETDELSLNRGAMGPEGVLYVAAFNEDALYGFDTTCDQVLFGPVDLAAAPDLAIPEGPIGVVPVRDGGRTDVYFAMSNGNRLGRARLEYPSR